MKKILFHWKKVFLPQSAFNNHDKNAQIFQFHSIPSNTNKTLTDLTSVQLLSRVWLFATPWTAALQASLSITNSWSLLKLMSIELVMPSNHLICRPLLPLSSVFPSIRVFSNELALCNCWVVCRFYTTEITNHLLTCINSTERKIHHPIPTISTLVVSLTVKKPCILFTYSSTSLIICYIFYWTMTACLALC